MSFPRTDLNSPSLFWSYVWGPVRQKVNAQDTFGNTGRFRRSFTSFQLKNQCMIHISSECPWQAWWKFRNSLKELCDSLWLCSPHIYAHRFSFQDTRQDFSILGGQNKNSNLNYSHLIALMFLRPWSRKFWILFGQKCTFHAIYVRGLGLESIGPEYLIFAWSHRPHMRPSLLEVNVWISLDVMRKGLKQLWAGESLTSF